LDSFIPGLELNRLFYHEVVGPILAAEFPDLAYSSALIGYGSDVLGYDTPMSADHEWGPRLLLFLEADADASLGDAIHQVLQHRLPPIFRGYSTNFTAPDLTDNGIRRREALPEGGLVNHHIQIMMVEDILLYELGVASVEELSASDWLSFPEQKLLEVTAGEVFYDGLDQLLPLREKLAYYPQDVWLYRLAAAWRRIAQEEAFVGRSGDVGDDLGSHIVAARLARDLMRLCFLLERKYAPYSKWLGTAFSRLASAEEVGPMLLAALGASAWQERERYLAEAYAAVARRQNALALVSPDEDPSPRLYFGRPYQVIFADRFADRLAAAIRNPNVLQIVASSGLVGGVDQWADSTDLLQPAALSRRAGICLYGERIKE
jgi:hypothetical protein